MSFIGSIWAMDADAESLPSIDLAAIYGDGSGAADTSRSARKFTAAATRSNTTPTKNTRRPSRSRSMAAVYDGNVAESLIELGRFAEAKGFLPDVIAFSVSRHGANHIETLKLRWRLATSLYKCEGASISDCEEAVATLEDVILISRRVCGTNHPTFTKAPIALESAREALARARARVSKD